MKIQIHNIEQSSRTNGPGLRAVVWFQGCTLHCPGCFNPQTHNPLVGNATDTRDLALMLRSAKNSVEGISVSGGEPFQQSKALLDLLIQLSNSGLSVLVFTGYSLDEVKRIPLGIKILQHVDVLVAGRYRQTEPSNQTLLGSANQKLHLLTNRYRLADFASIPRTEAILHKDGTVTISGFHPWGRKTTGHE